MVNEVNKIVYNTLISEQAVTLPGVGTLLVKRVAASMQSKDVVAAPVFTVEFSSHVEAVSVVDVIAREGGVDTARAEDIYTRWLDKVRSGSVLTIEGVGVLRNKNFELDKEFFAQLNPSQNSVKIKQRKSGAAIAAALVSTFIGVAVLCGGVAWFFCCGDEETSTQEMVTDVEPIAPEPIVEIETESVAVENIVECEPVETIEEELVVVDDWTMQEEIHHWVVAGSYSTQENADRAMADISKRNGDIRCKSFKLGKMYAVAVYGSISHDECDRFVKEYNGEFKQMWIFTPRKHR